MSRSCTASFKYDHWPSHRVVSCRRSAQREEISSSLPQPIVTNSPLSARGFPLRDAERVDHPSFSSSPNSSTPGGVLKDDLTEIKNSLARKLRGVASFLNQQTNTDSQSVESAAMRKMDGIKSDLAEIGGKVKAELSKFFQPIPDEDYQAKRPAGVTDELLAFVRDLVLHPRTWVRFPLPAEANADDFALNDPQQLHVGAVERHIPELCHLRWELCPKYLSEGRFWMIYFVLVYPKLNKYDALVLSSPQIVEARALLTRESKHQTKVKQTEGTHVSSDGLLRSMEPSTKDVSTGASTTDSTPELAVVDFNCHNDVLTSNKASAAANDSSEVLVRKEVDDWLNEETPDVNGSPARDIPISNDEDVSFSALKIDDTKENEGHK